MVVTCCIDSHFTAFKMLRDKSLIYYDPLKSGLSYIRSGPSCTKFAR
jgi:hypothetical protein